MTQERYTAEQVAEAITETRGFITYTAKRLGCDRSTVYNYIKRYPICADAVADAREGFLDMAEMALHKKVQDEDITAIIFALKTVGKSRGYAQRYELTGSDGGALEVKIDYGDGDDFA